MRFHIKDGYGRKHIDLLALIMLAAMVSVVGSGILYLGERVHAPGANEDDLYRTDGTAIGPAPIRSPSSQALLFRSVLFWSMLFRSVAPLAAVTAVRAGHAGRRADAPYRRKDSEAGNKFPHRGSSVGRPV